MNGTLSNLVALANRTQGIMIARHHSNRNEPFGCNRLALTDPNTHGISNVSVNVSRRWPVPRYISQILPFSPPRLSIFYAADSFSARPTSNAFNFILGFINHRRHPHPKLPFNHFRFCLIRSRVNIKLDQARVFFDPNRDEFLL